MSSDQHEQGLDQISLQHNIFIHFDQGKKGQAIRFNRDSFYEKKPQLYVQQTSVRDKMYIITIH